MSIVDILLLTYDNLFSTLQCVKNLYNYTNSNDFKLFILDNGSQEDTIKYLEKIQKQYNNMYINFQEKNCGIIKGRNKCFDFSRKNSDSKYICFIDNDQHVQKDWLVSYLEMFKSYNIVGKEAWKMRDDFYPLKKIKNKNESFSYVGCGGMMMNCELFEKLGKFDERFHMYYEDPNLCFEAYYKGYKIGWNYNQVVIHNHKGVLLKRENRKYFLDSWQKFKNKWKGKEVPILSNNL